MFKKKDISLFLNMDKEEENNSKPVPKKGDQRRNGLNSWRLLCEIEKRLNYR